MAGQESYISGGNFDMKMLYRHTEAVLQLIRPILRPGISLLTLVFGLSGLSLATPLATQISLGGAHSCVVTGSGGAKCWGGNYSGQVGDNTVTTRRVPTDVYSLATGVSEIAGGGNHTCVATSSGNVRCWGYNMTGQVGFGTNDADPSPAPSVSALDTYNNAKVATGGAHSCALTTGGGVFCWGDNYYTQLGVITANGNLTTTLYSRIALQKYGSGYKAITAGANHTCALTTAGAVKCWGDNQYWQAGDWSTVAGSGLDSGVLAIAAGSNHTCAITSAGGVKCWGSNFNGQVGNGFIGNGSGVGVVRPVDVVGLTSGVIAIEAAYNHSCALTTSGGVKCWGTNTQGQLGDGTTVQRLTPVDVVGLTSGVAKIAAGGFEGQNTAASSGHTCAITNNFLGGTVKCWGDNRNGQLGDNTLTYSTQPVDVIGLSPPDTSAPSVPANLVATNTYTQQIDLSWSPSTDNVAVANYQLYRDGVLKATFNGTASLDSSLTPNTQYTYTVAACDGSGNCSAQSVPLVTKTLPIPDITKPSVPTGLVAVVAGPTQINLTWNAATDNVGVTVYQLYRGGALYYSTAGLSYSDTGALPQTTYIYTVTSCDAAGNCSDPSSLASATTPALPDSQAPTVPTSLVASAINATQINLTWVASTDNVGVTSYAVYRGATLAGTVAGGITHYSDYGLTNNTAYSYTVKACDAVLNCSTASNTASATTPVPPDTQAPTVPTNLSAVAAGTTRISLTWTAATDNIGVVSYRVSRDGAVQAVLGNVTSFSDSGMLAGTIHQYSVSACDSSGNCSVQSGTTWATTSPATVPDAPTIGSATPKDYSAVISFYAPAVDGGAAISGYSVLCNPGGVVTPGVGSPITVTGLTKGTSYTCQVRAANSVGSGPYSAASNIVVPTGPSVPGTPPVPTAVAGNGLATVQVTSPSNNGGSPILGYSVISNPAGGTDLNNNSTTSVHTVTGLTNGVGYTFTVTARNALGTSLASSPSASVVPKTVPRAPIMGLAVTGSGSATLSFQAPMDNGGSAITGYTVISNPAGGIDAQAGTMALSRTITGLSDGMTYTFTAVATNVVGTGAASSASNTVVPRSVPSAPIMRAATPYNASAVVSFLPPSFNGGATVSGFTVVSNPSGGIDSAAGSTASEHRIINLVNGTAYTFTVTATNAVGTGPASSPSASVTPLVSATVSDPPTTVTATTGNANATVSFTPPTMIGGSAITGYSVSSYPVGGVDSAVGTLSTSHLVTGLTNSVAYTFTVTATNAQGTSLSSIPSNSVTPRSAITAPSAPRGVSASAENGAATVSFLVADTTGGAAILGYTVTSSPASGTDVHAGTLATSHRISGLVNGTTYTFTVIASNSAGTSPASLPSAGVVPMGVPGAPTVTTVTAGNTSAMVAFSAPSNNGGSAIMGYTVTSIPPGGVDLGAGSLATTRNITGLLNGTSYRFVVTAGNVVGAGPGSAPSTSVTPKGVPGVPTISNIQAGNASLTLTFLPPASDGGDPITGYYVSCTSSGTGSAAAQTVIGSPVNLSSLTVGQPYACTVTAINGQGMGLASVTSNFVTPTASVGNAACGPSHGTIFTSRPTDGLCTTGTPTEVVGGGPWTWSCTGGTGTRNDHCIAFPPTQPIYKISTIAGNGTSGYSGDGGPATAASINGPQSLAADSDGNLYIADTNNSKLRKVDPIGVISTVATIPSIWAVTTRLDGTVLVPFNGSINSYGSNGFMTVIGLNSYGFGSATGIATANTGDIYVVNRTNHLVVRVANDGTAGLMAGNGTSTLTRKL